MKKLVKIMTRSCKLMERCRERNAKLNKDKTKLRLEQVPYIGNLLTSQGLKPDPDKVKAILKMPKPADVAAVRRFIGFVNYLSKFLPRLSEVCEPLRRVEDDERCRVALDTRPGEAFNRLKQLVTEVPVLKYFEPSPELTLQSDACDTGLGAVLTQNGQPIAFASRALSDAETRCSQVEKELLAVVFGLEKFHQYTYGSQLPDLKPGDTVRMYHGPSKTNRGSHFIHSYGTDVFFLLLAHRRYLGKCYSKKGRSTKTRIL